MARKKLRYPERPWHPDPAKWNVHLVHPVPVPEKPEPPKPKSIEPDKGWQLWDWNTLEDVKQ